MCLYPSLLKNPKYKKNKKNGGNPPPLMDLRVQYVPIGCKRCIECRKQKTNEWRTRLMEDIRHHRNGKFITLTFSNESYAALNKEIPLTYKDKYGQEHDLEGYDRDNAIATLAVRRFLERWRKHNGKSVRHWLITELGHKGTENIHLHGIIWTNDIQQLEARWQYGYVWKGYDIMGKLENYVNEKTVNYCTKYCTKVDKQHKYYQPTILCTEGIGGSYTYRERSEWKQNKYNGENTNETYRTRSGVKIALPIYWRNKIYTDQEREQLWLHKLDKNERWIMGIKIDMNQPHSEQAYYRILQHWQSQNISLGYGSNQLDWKREHYENERRKIIQNYRIQQAP